MNKNEVLKKFGGREYCGRMPFCGCGGPEPLPERDTTKPTEQQGVFRKFDVRRVDGSDQPGGKHHGCEYFVLDVDHDPHAKAALTAYAAVVEATHPVLAADMRERYGLAKLTAGVELPQLPSTSGFNTRAQWLEWGKQIQQEAIAADRARLAGHEAAAEFVSIGKHLYVAPVPAQAEKVKLCTYPDCGCPTETPCLQGLPLTVFGAQAEKVEPVDMVLYCPKCGTQHIDAPESDDDYRNKHLALGGFDNQWTNPPHKSHLCHGCGHIWRPSDTPTNGVLRTASGKDADTTPPTAPQSLLDAAEKAAQELANGYVECAEETLRASLQEHGSKA